MQITTSQLLRCCVTVVALSVVAASADASVVVATNSGSLLSASAVSTAQIGALTREASQFSDSAVKDLSASLPASEADLLRTSNWTASVEAAPAYSSPSFFPVTKNKAGINTRFAAITSLDVTDPGPIPERARWVAATTVAVFVAWSAARVKVAGAVQPARIV
ncbi:MAG: hypothetical protein M3Y69_10855 [Verrucomicrobiota bacterium]|nr:hypothetical protein [Verrucomicrobiota bacterium]